ncbi:MAG TPA: serine/threonine-protein kinase [Thermoanaerobaculia bacterium]|nr:serine/threonine-protein kinase [Thermoanaerobaculia bacterium]
MCGSATASPTVPFGEAPTVNDPRDRSADSPSPRHPVTAYQSGHIYAERYRIEGFLGRGGMGSVYKVYDTNELRTLALKILHASAGDESGGTERFKREIKILAQIQHPAVPRIHGWGIRNGEMFFVADFVEGDNLRALIRRSGPLDVAGTAALGASVADALEVAHQYGIVHRDVKPHNIMVGNGGMITLLDFGVARGVGLDMKTITATGMIVGTPEYMSPEQFEGLRVDRRSDIYSLGVVLFEAVTGRLPFAGDTPISVALKHRSETPPSPRSIRRDTPAWLERLILRCLEKEPPRRFDSAAELATALRKERHGERRSRRLPNGDAVVEDESEAEEWALVITSPSQKPEWSTEMALSFEERFYKLEQVTKTANPTRWIYRFSFWPQEQIFRKLLEYDPNAPNAAGSLSARVKNWLGPRKS